MSIGLSGSWKTCARYLATLKILFMKYPGTKLSASSYKLFECILDACATLTNQYSVPTLG